MIELVTGPNAIFNAIVSGGMLAFGVWVLTLTPRTRSTKLLAAFAIAGGSIHVPESLTRWTDWELYAVWLPYRILVFTIGGLALLLLARELLEPVRERGRRVLFAALAVVTALVLLPLTTWALTGFAGPGDLAGWRILSLVTDGLAGEIFFNAFLAVGIVLLWMHRQLPEGLGEVSRVQTVLVGAALSLWPAFQAGASFTALADPSLSLSGIADASPPFLAWMVLAGVWLATTSSVPEESRQARNVALVILGAMLLGMINAVFVEPFFAPADDPLFDLIRLSTVLVLGYAILRHEILGVEAKFRWGVSKTTVAGVFVAVFFVVSEGAQALFAGFAGNELIGVLAAGALVFAISPLQRMADRFATKAVPGGTDGTSRPAEDRYRTAVEMALMDGEVTEDEERRLAELVEELDLSPTQAFELRREVEGQMGSVDEP